MEVVSVGVGEQNVSVDLRAGSREKIVSWWKGGVKRHRCHGPPVAAWESVASDLWHCERADRSQFGYERLVYRHGAPKRYEYSV